MTKRATVQLLWAQVYNSLRQDILTGVRQPGERLTELAIAREMGTSQGPVREALKRLEEEGLVSSVPHSGTFVSQVDATEMREVFALRTAVEGLAASRAATRITPADLEHLQSLINEITAAAAADDMARLAATDLAFHSYVCRLSQHQMLMRVFRVLENQILRYAHVARQLIGAYQPEAAAAEHLALLDALRSGNPEQAARAFQDHIAWGKVERRMQQHR